MKKIAATTALLLIILSQVIPQKYEFYHEKLKLGDDPIYDLPWCLHHDRKGFMWFGTRAGLYRYDAYNFKLYIHDALDTCSLSDHQIVTLSEGDDEHIWIGTFLGGLNRYNPDTDNFTRYPGIGADPFNLKNSTIWAICSRRNGTIWFSAHSRLSQGVYVLNPGTGKINPIIHDTIISGHFYSIHTRCIYEDGNGDIWTGDANGLHKYNTEEGVFIHYRNDPEDPYSLSNDTVISIFEDRSGAFWIGTCHGLNQFDRRGEQFTRYFHDPENPYSLSNNIIGALSDGMEDNLIIKTSNGINFLDKQTGEFGFWNFSKQCLFKPQADINDYLAFRSLYLDTCGILWFTTCEFDKLILQKKKFTLLDSITPSGLYQDDTGDLWIGTRFEGLYKVNAKHSGRILETLQDLNSGQANPDSMIHHYPDIPGDPNSLSSELLISICRDRDGVLWLGGAHSGNLYELNQPNSREQLKIYRSEYLSDARTFRLTGIYEDRSSNLWIGRDNGLEIFDRKQKKFYQYILDSGKHEFHNVPIVTSIREDKSGSIWFGTWFEGLFKIIPRVTFSQKDLASGTKTLSYKYDPELPKDLSHHVIWSLCVPEVRDVVELWIGTNGGGIFGLIRDESSKGNSTERFIHYTKADGLPGNVVRNILEDDSGNLWISTLSGISKFDPETEKFNNYYVCDGVPFQKFYWSSALKGKNGDMFFGGNSGLLAFHPDSIEDNPHIPPVVITDFKLFNHPVIIGEGSILQKSITETTDLDLSYRENYLSFEFAALNYINPDKNRYRYKMEGLDRTWIDAGNQRQAIYTNMKPGKYKFRVIGSNKDGIWNEEGATLGIMIQYPPWLRWWAYLFYGVIIAGIIIGYRNYILKRERLEADLQLKKIEVEKVQEIDQIKTRFFSNISHEFRTPLTLILGPLEKLIADRPNVNAWDWNVFDVMRKNARKLKDLINEILDLSKLETGQMKIRVSESNITEFIRNIVLSYLSLAESRNIAYKFKLVETSDPTYFDREKLDKIVCNLITNAFKFTPEGGEIAVKLTFINKDHDVPELMDLTVRDSGQGIPEKLLDRIFDRFYKVEESDSKVQEGTGLGLSLVKELVSLYRGEITVNSKLGKGSTFRVRLPVSLISFNKEEIIEFPLPGDVVEPVDKADLHEDDMQEQEVTGSIEDSYIPGRPILLIVEDKRDLRNYITQSLGSGFLFHDALNGRDGLEKAVKHIPDLIISDIMMPEMDGIEMCKRLKTDQATSHIPIIILTARGDMDSKVEGLETGADDYLVKPFDAKELKARVRNLIEQRRKLRELYRKEMILGEDFKDMKPPDEQFLTRVTEEVYKHIPEANYSVRELGEALGMSRSQIYRKIHALTDQTANEFIRNTKLKYAAELFDQGYKNVAEVTYNAGFNSPSYFSSCFRKLYGKNPTEYMSG